MVFASTHLPTYELYYIFFFNKLFPVRIVRSGINKCSSLRVASTDHAVILTWSPKVTIPKYTSETQVCGVRCLRCYGIVTLLFCQGILPTWNPSMNNIRSNSCACIDAKKLRPTADDSVTFCCKWLLVRCTLNQPAAREGSNLQMHVWLN